MSSKSASVSIAVQNYLLSPVHQKVTILLVIATHGINFDIAEH